VDGNITEERRRAHQKLLLNGRWNKEDNNTLKTAYYTATLAEFIEKTLAKSPPLTAAQADRIVGLIRSGANHG
jgi:hypothetical protein